MLAKEHDVDKDISTKILQGLLKNGIHKKGKHVDWIKLMGVTHLSVHRKELPFIVQVFQVFVFSLTHHFIFVLIVHIFVDASHE